jgi:hypothetical protein
MKWGGVTLSLSVGNILNKRENVFVILMRKCIKWVKIVLHLEIFELSGGKSFSTGNVLKGLMYIRWKNIYKLCLRNLLNEDTAIYKQECYYFHIFYFDIKYIT